MTSEMEGRRGKRMEAANTERALRVVGIGIFNGRIAPNLKGRELWQESS